MNSINMFYNLKHNQKKKIVPAMSETVTHNFHAEFEVK